MALRRDELLQRLFLRPGFALRRAHQPSQGLFEDGCRDLRLTPPRYGVLTIVAHAGESDQATVARALGFDRVTTLRIVRGLQARGLAAPPMQPRHLPTTRGIRHHPSATLDVGHITRGKPEAMAPARHRNR